MEIKKTLYNELIGEILKEKQKEVVLKMDSFQLDFGVFSTIFSEKTKYFVYFC